jgi:preprotein translocase subunit SecA
MAFLKNLIDFDKREIKKIDKIVGQVLALEKQMESMSDQELKDQTFIFKERLANGETEDDVLIDAYATVREAAWRALGMKHFPVQILGGIALHRGNIAEMRTGEGKTLVATLPAYLNALSGKGVQIVTVNDYLATRDKEWMGQVYEFLGLSVGLIVHGLTFDERKKAYNCDITYGTNNEYGFDYLRDNMVVRKDRMVQRKLNYAIIDEVDSVLIDEARTPLIISTSGQKSTEMYSHADIFARSLKFEDDYEIDEKANSIMLTDQGVEKAERQFSIDNLTDIENMEIAHHINQALRARYLMTKDVDYVVKDGEIVIVDEFTGRLMPGRRYSKGLHQAIEAKEKVNVQKESKTLATITYQNYFRMYNKLSGMTGTAKTEEEEFYSIYGMDVLCIPTNKPIKRDDMNDLVFKNEKGKFIAVAKDVEECFEKGQPVLIGTISIEKSEELSKILKKRGIKHEVLNAKHHEQEANIVSNAGQMGSVTISTNMAGRGTDIVLGEGVVELGGLHIIGTERHESRRIDNQLRGRAGRQGDPGSSQFYVSLEDDLMRLFGSERVLGLVDSSLEDDIPIENRILTKGIENAQKRVEGKNFDIRKHVLQYDDVMNKQREIIYTQRRQVLDGEDVHEQIEKVFEHVFAEAVGIYTMDSIYPEEWDFGAIEKHFDGAIFPKDSIKLPEEIKDQAEIIDYLIKKKNEIMMQKVEALGSQEELHEMERRILLRSVDSAWMDHIDNMDQLRQGIGLQAIGQVDPVRAYTKEGFAMFDDMNAQIREDTVKVLLNVNIQRLPQKEKEIDVDQLQTNKNGNTKKQPKKVKKVGRTAPCPCGSGKKYKQCCGKNA